MIAQKYGQRNKREALPGLKMINKSLIKHQLIEDRAPTTFTAKRAFTALRNFP